MLKSGRTRLSINPNAQGREVRAYWLVLVTRTAWSIVAQLADGTFVRCGERSHDGTTQRTTGADCEATAYVECPTCDGAGVTHYLPPNPTGRRRDVVGESIEQPCPTCCERGEVPTCPVCRGAAAWSLPDGTFAEVCSECNGDRYDSHYVDVDVETSADRWVAC